MKISLGSTKQTDRTLSKHVKILLSPASPNAYMRVALSCRYPHIEVLLSRSTTISELIEKLTQYWQLNPHAQSVGFSLKTNSIQERRISSFQLLRDDLSMEQFILYLHGSHLASTDPPSAVNDPISSITDLSARKQARSRSDSEHSIEPSSSIDASSNLTRKRNHLSESEMNNEPIGMNHSSISPPATSSSANKSNLARTAMLSAAKRAASNNNYSNNHDVCAFTLIDGVEDEADSSTALLKQRFDAIDLIDEVNQSISVGRSFSIFLLCLVRFGRRS